MNHTQVELTAPSGISEVWWLPVPEKRAKVGEKITRPRPTSCADEKPEGCLCLECNPDVSTDTVDWKITQVCVTLPEDVIPIGARVARSFQREAQTLAYMSF